MIILLLYNYYAIVVPRKSRDLALFFFSSAAKTSNGLFGRLGIQNDSLLRY